VITLDYNAYTVVTAYRAIGIKTNEASIIVAIISAIIAADSKTEGVVLEGVLLALPGPSKQKGQGIIGLRPL
jgi:hypothetical protein